MRYYKKGNTLICTIGALDLPEITAEEYEAETAIAGRRMEVQAAVAQAHRPFTESEVMGMLIPQQINTLEVDDNTALRMKGFYPAFGSMIGQSVKQGFKFVYGDKLWKTEQPEMIIESQYLPGEGTESLYCEVCQTHAGTIDDPIPYDGNMALESGLYYMQDWVIYRCIRDTVTPVYHALAELVDLYVENA